METITSRQNPFLRSLRRLQTDRDYRREMRQYVCEGETALREAETAGLSPISIVWKQKPGKEFPVARACCVPADLYSYVSGLKNSPGPLFTVAMPSEKEPERIRCGIVLENVQDPGNVGTVLRTAAAFGMDAVLCTGDCADIYHPRTVRASMGAIFRQPVVRTDDVGGLARRRQLPLVAAVPDPEAPDVRTADLRNALVVVGNEGSGITPELLRQCSAAVRIPMAPSAESLNASVAAAILMWEMVRPAHREESLLWKEDSRK
jgi:TrmH family RNA methyltransferase